MSSPRPRIVLKVVAGSSRAQQAREAGAKLRGESLRKRPLQASTAGAPKLFMLKSQTLIRLRPLKAMSGNPIHC